ncbi:hypothetical protein VDGD_03142 [Verticillium dahliae]|nr:Ras-related GTP-binding protein A [Verticillium dahliae VDG1]RBQ82361.1 hypothetical protein VDGD_03142 [Verticillium dahliae]
MRPRANQAVHSQVYPPVASDPSHDHAHGMTSPALEGADQHLSPQSRQNGTEASASATVGLNHHGAVHPQPIAPSSLPISGITTSQTPAHSIPDPGEMHELQEYHEQNGADGTEGALAPQTNLEAFNAVPMAMQHPQHVSMQLADPHLEGLLETTNSGATSGPLSHTETLYPPHLTVSPHAPIDPVVVNSEDQSFLLTALPPVQPAFGSLNAPGVLTLDLHAQLNLFSTAQPTSLGPENHGLNEFLRIWALSDRWGSSSMPGPRLDRISAQLAAKPMRMSYEELDGEGMDLQGLDWEDIGVSRKYARERRKLTYKNYTNKLDSDKWKIRPFDGAIPSSENFYRFRRMDLRRNVHLAHFQLRNVLACADRSHVFYPGRDVIHRINPLSGHSDVAMDLSDLHHVQISTLDAKHGMLVVGTFNGEYCMRSVHSQDPRFTEGQVTNNSSCITNHLQIHESRHSNSPLVAFASNDQGFRVMDIATQKFTLDTKFKFPMNCTALSPDGRLRVMVGDSNSVIIACAESGGPVQWLSGHRDHGFACAWSEDGWTVATAAQDKSVKIWDARRWTNSSARATPVATIRSELASVRGLRFSPVGNGPPVLVAAEEADFVNIVNARTFRHKQTIDVFGEIGGVGFTDDGNELNILCTDRHRGGLIQLDRCNYGSKSEFICSFQPNTMDDIWKQPYRSALHDEEGLDEGLTRGGPAGPRTRLYWDDMEPF